MMKIVDMLNDAISKNELKKYLLGTAEYRIPSREGYESDRISALKLGIHEMYKKNPEIKNLFENCLIDMLNGKEIEIVIAFYYIWNQLLFERRNKAPFELDKKIYLILREKINEKEMDLRAYRYPDFGGGLENGAYEYMSNINQYFEENKGGKVF